MALQLSLWRSCDAIHQLQPRGSPQSRARLARRSQLVVHAGFNSGRWVLSDKETSKRYELVGRRIVVGRKAQDGVDVVIDDGSVSGTHCELNIGTNSITITDLESTNGTAVNGRKVGRGGRVLVRSGDTLELGDVELVVTCEREAPVEQKTPKPKAKPEARPPIRTAGLDIADIKLGPKIGGGSFGTVFSGQWKGQNVVLKQANKLVENAAQLLYTEYLLNVRVAAEAPNTCAEFVGALEVSAAEAGASYAGKLTEGLWLVWKNQGEETLASYLEKPTFAKDLAAALGMEKAGQMAGDELEEAVVKMVMRELFEDLAKLHKMGIVHRDVKPANMVVDEDKKKVVLIDLGGAAACLGEPISYEPGTGAYDPLYAPPEKYLLPEESPEPNASISQMLWRQNTPDLFDTFSAGMVLLQLALPALRSEKAFKGFAQDMEQCGSMRDWRERYGVAIGNDSILSAGNGAGWNLVLRLTTPPRTAKGGRMTAEEALQHPFFK